MSREQLFKTDISLSISLFKPVALSNTFCCGSLLASCGSLFEVHQVEGVRSFDWHTQSARPHLRGHHAERARNAEEHSVVVVLGQAVVHKQSARTAVNVGPGVLDLASGSQEVGNRFVVCLDEIHKVVILDVLAGEVKLKHEARIRLSKNGMAVSRHNLARLESVGNVLLDVILGPVLTVLLLEFEDEAQALLVCETVQGASKTVHACGKRKIRVGESRANQVSGVSRHISTFVITKSR